MNKKRMYPAPSLSSRSRFAMTIALVVIFTSVVFSTTTVLASTPQGRFEQTLQVNGPVDLEVLTHSGDVTVRAGSSGSVLIRGKIYIGNHWLTGNRQGEVHEIEQHPPIRQEGNKIQIAYIKIKNIRWDSETS